MSTEIPTDRRLALEERQLALEERQLALEERRLSAEMRGQRTGDEIAFELEMRMATSLACSPFLPENVGKNPDERIAAAWGVLRYAKMLGVDPYVLAQQICVVHGRVGFSAQFLIALVNTKAELTRPLDWSVTGSWAANDIAVTCTATDKHGTERTVTLTKAQVDAWKWATKPGEPWKADPVLMMKYRTASQLIRLYFAGAVMGMTMTAEELRDIERTEVEVVARPVTAPRMIAEGTPGRDFVAEAQAEAARREAVEAKPVDADPLATLPGPVADWLAELAEELRTDPATVVAYLRGISRDPAGMSDSQLANARLALANGGSKRADLVAFIGAPAAK